jgi:hypothetical protein
MFAADDLMIDAPFQVVSGRLTHLLNHRALHAVCEDAYEGGWELTLRVGPFGGVRGLSRLVRVRTLEPVHRGERMTVALRWEATGATGDLFPVLDAELILSSAGEGRSRLELLGSYRPPWGRAGVVVDKMIMGRVAEATIGSLLDDMVAFLMEPEPGWQVESPAPHVLPLANPEET